MLKERPYLSCKVLCRNCRIAKGLVCEFFMIRSACKVPPSLSSPSPGHESEGRQSHEDKNVVTKEVARGVRDRVDQLDESQDVIVLLDVLREGRHLVGTRVDKYNLAKEEVMACESARASIDSERLRTR
jgi:hypothetical protein